MKTVRLDNKGFAPLENTPRLATERTFYIRARGLMSPASSLTGFTLIEVIIVIGLLAIFGSLALVSFQTSRATRELATSTQDILSALRLAQSKTLSGENNSVWGVHMSQSQVALFQGPTFVGSPLVETYGLPSSLELINILFNGGGNDIVFNRITGTTDQNGTMTLGVVATPTLYISLTIDISGAAYETNAFSALTSARTIDMRHRAFDLGWSIKTAITMTLTFADPPNPDTVNSVTMASFFDAGKTKFDWSGITSVGGMDQDLRIHTTSLTDTDTILSVDRDCRKNTKKLTIAIDGKAIAAYEADCKAMTVGAFGGSVSEP
ncbi:MAG: prepilin-type N-terminal cleavage/methylation domain-containing protein [Candidatus Sungbacteria bacterium]|nr:prepilin-type N-terminal cleavage/methylation domain-containing protein [bacterium]MDZ4260033.1 prepilin-type N-terminal cleavage/methylation domain-containing protein [Candidatus Sungbacteria bacterium]